MDELGGEWVFDYGRRRRSVQVDRAVVAVRAGRDATHALRAVDASSAERTADAYRRAFKAYEDLALLLYGTRYQTDDADYERGLWQLFPSQRLPSFVFDRDGLAKLRQIKSRVARAGGQTLADSIGAVIAALDDLPTEQPIDSVRNAADGTWVRVSARAIEALSVLHRTAGTIALPELGTERLLTDSAFCLIAEDLPPGKLDRALAEKGWVLKSHLSFHSRAMIVQPLSRDGSPFVALRRAFADRDPLFERIEPIFLEPIHGRWRPSDPRYPDQWQYNNDGRNGGRKGADIRAEKAWDRTRGKGVRVAVIDNGVHVNHPDLKSAIKRGGWFEGGTTGSASFVELSASNRREFPTDNHGTFCAGMVGARANKQGGCGAAPECELVAIACLEDQVGTQLTLARAIAYAADPSREVPDSKERGADVISCSLGPNGEHWQISTPLELAIEFATSSGRGGKGTPIFWATSNERVDITHDEVVSHPSVIAVSRSNNNDSYDNAAYGSTLAFVAPGANVLSTSGAASYAWDTGCSFAAPLAAGVAALVLARDSQLSATDVKDRLCDTCDKVGGYPYGPDGRNDAMGHGRINADRAVR